MITIIKTAGNFYLKIVSLPTESFNNVVAFLRTKHFRYIDKKGYTSKNPKLLLDALIELGDYYDIFIKDEYREEIENHNPYSAIKPKRLRFDMSYFEKFPPMGQYQIDDALKMASYGKFLNANKMGLGKAQPHSSKVLTDNGWKLMGDIKVGDLVATEKGTFAKVLELFPQGEQDIYELTFNDGSSARSTKDHLWQYQTHNDLFHKKNKKRIATVEQLLSGTIKEGTVVIPMTQPIQFPEKEFEIEPWYMGVLLGNGCFLSGSVTFSSTKPYLVEKLGKYVREKGLNFKDRGKNTFAIIGETYGPPKKNIVINTLRDYGLFKKGSKEKFIPKDYLFSSVEQRVAILTGLIDIDGYVSKDGYVLQYSTSSEQLKDDVLFLVQSLGGAAIVSSKIPRIKEKEYSKHWCLTLKMPPEIIPISIPEKLVRFKPKSKYPPRRVLRTIELVGREEASCISIDSDSHLYLTDNCIVTHNTYSTIQAINQLFALKLADRVLVLTIPSTLYNWKHEILKFSDFFKEEDVLIVLESNREVFYTKELPKIVICSYNTFKLCSDYAYRQKNKTLKNYRTPQIDLSDWGNINKVVVCDEVHTIKNIKTRWTQIVHLHKHFFEYRFGLSGTPAPNGLQEFYSLLKFLDDGLVDDNYIDFLHTIGEVGTNFSRYALAYVDEEKAKNFYDRIEPIIVRRFLRDHIELPQVHRQNIYIELTGKHKEIYQSVVNDSLTVIKEEKGVITYKDLQMRFPYILQSITDPLLIQDKILELSQSFKFDDCVKVHTLDTLLSDLFFEDRKRKMIVWGTHPATLDRLGERYKKYKPIVIHGQSTPKGVEKYEWRHKQIEEFEKSDSRLLIANPSVLGTGTNIAFANGIINYDRTFNYTIAEQSGGRLERIGLSEEATIYNLIVDKSLEIHLDKVLENKKMIDENFLSTGYLTQEKVKDIFAGG